MLRRRLMQSGGIPEGALSGQFTINSSGDKVYFSKGNLQYNKNAATWSFMEHQYSTVETDGQDVGDNYANQNVVSLFGWGTSGKTFVSGYGTAYQPYATSSTRTDYGPTNGTSGLTGTYADGDWGVNMGTGWRTLTNSEWYYVTASRKVNGSTGNGYSYTAGEKVYGVLGVVLYPDDYTGDKYTTYSNWEDFEKKGCVFLPLTCYRKGTSISYNGYGSYWSTTTNRADLANILQISSAGANASGVRGYRSIGYSVRLVYDVTGG